MSHSAVAVRAAALATAFDAVAELPDALADAPPDAGPRRIAFADTWYLRHLIYT
jgi:hypothetical protein